MIAELFYPKELKQLIADLRAKDDLNEEAVTEVNKSIRTPLLLGAILLIALIYGSNGWYFYASLFLAVLAGCFFAVRGIANKLVFPYTLGNSVQGKIENIRFGKGWESPDVPFVNLQTPKGWYFVYSCKNESGHLINNRFTTLPENSIYPPLKTGDSIEVFIYPENGKYTAPFLPAYFKNFCLSRSRIQSQLVKGKSDD